jgi:DNA-binding MarR family transcriptional regulator
MKKRVTARFPKKRFLKLLSVTKLCPLLFEDRLVYSLCVYLSVKKIKLSKRRIARRLCLDDDTVRRSAKRLVVQNLIEPDGVTARMPDEDREDWFVRISRTSPKWQEQLGYLPIPLPKAMPPGVSWRTLAVHSFLFSRADGEGKAKTCAAEIARILRLDPRTVRKSLHTLEGQLLIELDERNGLIRVDHPDQKWLDFFQDQKQQADRPPTFSQDRPWEGKTEAEINAFVYAADINAYTSLLRHMRNIGRYSTLEMQRVRAMARKYEIDDRTLSIIYHDVEKKHRAEQNMGSYVKLSSFSLLNYRISEQYGDNSRAS